MNLELIFTSFPNQFISIVLIHFFAVISPGPDFAIVTKQSFAYGRKYALMTTLGISVGIVIHMIYCIVGVGYLLSTNLKLFNFFKIIGSLYLFYNGLKSLLKSNINVVVDANSINNQNYESLKKSFFLGFVTNVFNPKATLFFLALFAMLVNSNTSMYVQVLYGLWMIIITGLWFCLVSYFFTSHLSRIYINKYSKLINKIMGIILMFISLRILLY